MWPACTLRFIRAQICSRIYSSLLWFSCFHSWPPLPKEIALRLNLSFTISSQTSASKLNAICLWPWKPHDTGILVCIIFGEVMKKRSLPLLLAILINVPNLNSFVSVLGSNNICSSKWSWIFLDPFGHLFFIPGVPGNKILAFIRFHVFNFLHKS